MVVVLRDIMAGFNSPNILFPAEDVLVGVEERTASDLEMGKPGVCALATDVDVDGVGRRETDLGLVVTGERVGDRVGERVDDLGYVVVEFFVEVAIRLGCGRGSVCEPAVEVCGGDWLLRLVVVVTVRIVPRV